MNKIELNPPKSIEDKLFYKFFNPGETIVRQGDKFCGVYVLLDGVGKVTTESPSGKEYVTHYMEAIGFIGDIEAITEMDTIINTIVAKTKCSTIRVDKASFFQWILEDKSFVNAYICAGAKRLTETDEIAKRRFFYTVDENIWQIFWEKSMEGFNFFNKSLIEKEVLSSSRSINRSLKKFADVGAISIERGVIYIEDIGKAEEVIKRGKGGDG